jgi:hypothetical protein
MKYRHLKWNMRSDVQVKSSQKSVLCRYTGLTRIGISVLLLAPIAHLQVRIYAEIGLVVGVEIGYTTSFGVPQSKYAICAGPGERDFSCLRRPFTMPTSVTETRVILRVMNATL